MNKYTKIGDNLINVNNITYIEEKHDTSTEYNYLSKKPVKYHFMTSTIYFTGGSKLVLKGMPLIELERLLFGINY